MGSRLSFPVLCPPTTSLRRYRKKTLAYLLYGIMKEPVAIEINVNLTGVNGKPVIFVAAHGLCAAVSEMDAEEGAPPVAELLAYAQVVEAIHCRQAVVPMRYGCFLNGIPAIRDVLKERQGQYVTLLAELTGCVEMGIRILLPEKGCEHIPPEATSVPNGKSTLDGRSYLALRKIHYRMQAETIRDRQALIDRYIEAFSGLYAKHRTEIAINNGIFILSFYFLTPKSAVFRFREIFENMMAQGDDEAMVSGPWPPYNFVTTDIGKYGDTIPNHLSP